MVGETTHLFWKVEATVLEPPREAQRARDDLGNDEGGLSCLLPAATVAHVFTTLLLGQYEPPLKT